MTIEFLRQLQATDAATLPTDLNIEAAEAGNAAADARPCDSIRASQRRKSAMPSGSLGLCRRCQYW
jgi:hypothetical protein